MKKGRVGGGGWKPMSSNLGKGDIGRCQLPLLLTVGDLMKDPV